MSLLAILVPCFSIFSSFVILFVYTIANLVLDAAARSNSRLLGVMEKPACEKIETPLSAVNIKKGVTHHSSCGPNSALIPSQSRDNPYWNR